ncbi:MAG: branched-chain amino acid ABC transporter permease [Desulfobacteraceae bacterium]|nr:branched-chain amino acid ABC transporter permease [Desulfobacteraceae bacterium]
MNRKTAFEGTLPSNPLNWKRFKVHMGIVGLLLIIPVFIKSTYVIDLLILCNIYAMFLSSWDLLTGYTGQISFGHSLFIGGGAYTAGFLSFYFNVPIWVTIPTGGLVAALLGYGLGLPALRLKGPYLALATFAASAVAAGLTAVFWEYSGGEDGLYGIASLSRNYVVKYYLSVALMVVICGFLLLLVNSQYGLILKSIREDESAAEASGINVTRYKLLTFVISGFLAGVAGAFYAHTQMHVGTDLLSLSLSIMVVLMSVVGGLGTIIGPIVAGYLLILLNEWLRVIEAVRVLIYSGSVVLILLFIPRGVVPTVISGIEALIKKMKSPSGS